MKRIAKALEAASKRVIGDSLACVSLLLVQGLVHGSPQLPRRL